MFSIEKFKIRFHRLIRGLCFHFIFWELAFLFFIFLTPDNYLFQVYLNSPYDISFVLFISMGTIAIAILFSLIDFIFTDRFVRFLPIRITQFIKSLLNFAIALSIIWIAEAKTFESVTTDDINSIIGTLTDGNILVLRFLVYFFLLCFLNNFIYETLKKVGSGNINSWMWGMLNKPHEQERIFMFIDLRSSTTIAEKLGHKKFSHLVQDVFNDLAIVDNYGGEIYQYLGDGAIVSWNLKQGLAENNVLRAFFAVSRLLERRNRYYNRKYGLEPKFKAGAHVGKVMVLQVGQIRRDISYNGDTMNTAARIESKCNEFKISLLISGDLYQQIPDKKAYRFSSVGEIELKGKRKAVEIYGVKSKVQSKAV